MSSLATAFASTARLLLVLVLLETVEAWLLLLLSAVLLTVPILAAWLQLLMRRSRSTAPLNLNGIHREPVDIMAAFIAQAVAAAWVVVVKRASYGLQLSGPTLAPR